MINEFVERFMKNKGAVRAIFEAQHPSDYSAIVAAVVNAVTDSDADGNAPDSGRIHCIDDGDYQGTLVFVIAAKGYQPSAYWYVMVDYGSCSGCDTLEAIRGYTEEPPTESQVDQYMTLALHIVQKLRKMEGGLV